MQPLTTSFKTAYGFAYWLIHEVVDKVKSSPILTAMPKGAIIKVIRSIPAELDHIVKLDFEQTLAGLPERDIYKFFFKFCLQLNINRNIHQQPLPPKDKPTLANTDYSSDKSTLSWIAQEAGSLAESIGHAVKKHQGIRLSAINFGLNYVISQILDQLSISLIETNIDEDQWRPLGIVVTTAAIASFECTIASLINLLEKKCQAIYISREQSKVTSSLSAALQAASTKKQQQDIIVQQTNFEQTSADLQKHIIDSLKIEIGALKKGSTEQQSGAPGMPRNQFNK